MKKLVWFSVATLALIVISGGSANSKVYKSGPIYDVSWPNCGANFAQKERGIVGVNGGLDFRPNHCLKQQLGWFKKIDVYVNTGYPGAKFGRRVQNFPKKCGADDNKCLAYNWGFNAGRYDIKYAALQGVIAKRWWLDVETVNSWSDSPAVNRQALIGMVDVISAYAGKDNIGYYSATRQWEKLTGSWHNRAPAWVATGSAKVQDARKACESNASSFTGGTVYLAQYTHKFDENVTCTSGGGAI